MISLNTNAIHVSEIKFLKNIILRIYNTKDSKTQKITGPILPTTSKVNTQSLP